MTNQISAHALNALILHKAVKVLDGSWAMDGSDQHALYRVEHIPGAQFFDLEAISDHSTPLPHMAPSAAQFAEAVGQLGISRQDHVVVYDRQGLFSAARVWWTFRLMGHEAVQVLSGGLPAWKAAGLGVEGGTTDVETVDYETLPSFDKVISLSALAKSAKTFLVLDARPKARFEGTAPEPRAGLRSGHMPGSRSLPFSELVCDGALKPRAELAAIFAERGVVEGLPVVTSCGSGVTAAILSMALDEVGHTQARLYDGSWAEWGQETLNTPVVTGVT